MRQARTVFCLIGATGLVIAADACNAHPRDADPYAARFTATKPPYVRGTPAKTLTPASSVDSAIAPRFTSAQAAAGAHVYQNVCARCHAVSQWSGATFAASWQNRRVSDFHGLVSATMPQDNPGALTMQQYLDVTAYVLEQAGFPSGSQPLTADTTSLRRARMVLAPKPPTVATTRG